MPPIQLKILSLNIARPQVMIRGERRLSTAINRRPAAGPLRLTRDGFEGDGVSDQSVHGGPERAVCCYPHEHYAVFAELLGRPLPIPSFGENLTTLGLLETEVCIGDTFRVGSDISRAGGDISRADGAIVQITQPRAPVHQLAMKNSEPRLPAWIIERGFTGWYFRVLAEGEVSPSDSLELIARPTPDITIAHVTRAVLAKQGDEPTLRTIAAAPALSIPFREMLERRLNSSVAGQNSEP